jgi:cell wall-associated NlpC family hydrolase
MTTRADVIAEARRHLQVRWVHQGRSRAGVDCVGLIIKVAHGLGLSTFDIADYSRQPDPVMMRSLLAEHMEAIAAVSAQPGDVLLMRFEREPQHVAIVTDIGIIHAYAQARKVVEHRLDSVWKSRIVGAYRFKGLD